jgi:hypothetical protein
MQFFETRLVKHDGGNPDSDVTRPDRPGEVVDRTVPGGRSHRRKALMKTGPAEQSV